MEAAYPVIPYKPRMEGERDQPLELQLVDLERLEAGGYMRVVHHAGEKGFHIKLVLNDREAISLFVWNDKVFRCLNTLARSYGVIPIEEIEVDEEEGDRLIAEGRYRLRKGVLELVFEKSYDPSIVTPGRCVYRLKLKGVREYISPKHGHSARPEYFLIASHKARGG
ncbi:hypothetical protein [Aeropyrum camini]|uniref:Uncharacterized protein n=1 Tax=Aeropyrum camini SY1 = JCM 12091 TaxID=1198449 RepID=U3TD80_9CREN|nr:hypothetical protein [Aeropyrum camini]BAN89985.1 hypothetical protein ACAM_0516 [Aeropyrum camini SY1 = JCM 12091]